MGRHAFIFEECFENSSLYMFTGSLFLILRTYTELILIARVRDCCLKSFKGKEIISYLQQLLKKPIQLATASLYRFCDFLKTFESCQVENGCANK